MLCWLHFTETWLVSDSSSEFTWWGGQGGHSCFTVVFSSRFKVPWRRREQRWPAYRHTRVMVAGPLARPKWQSPPRAADPLLPTFCLPAQPWLWIRGRPHVGGQVLMMAVAMPSLSCHNPRVQFWLMLFPADKMQTSYFFFFLIRGLGGWAVAKYTIKSVFCFIITWLGFAQLPCMLS